MLFSVNQIKKCRHMLGLDEYKIKYPQRKLKAWRNYYNSGYLRDFELDEMVDAGLMTVRDHGKEMGGYFYHLNDSGIKTMQEIVGPFIEDEEL